jgi:hypothetical protein
MAFAPFPLPCTTDDVAALEQHVECHAVSPLPSLRPSRITDYHVFS